MSMTAEKVHVGKRFENIANVCNEKYFFPFASKSRPDFREILHAILKKNRMNICDVILQNNV